MLENYVLAYCVVRVTKDGGLVAWVYDNAYCLHVPPGAEEPMVRSYGSA